MFGFSLKKIFQRSRLYESYDNLPDGIIVINGSKNIVLWNKQAKEIFGYTKREVTGKNIEFIFAEDAEKIQQSVADRKSSILESKTKSGDEIFVEITCCNSYIKKDVIISCRNVTKNQKILERLIIEYDKSLKISKNKSSFIANLSHELRTPMHSIIGFSQAMIDGLAGSMNAKQDKYINIINRNANSLLSLLNSILDLSKIEAGKMEFNFKLFDVVSLINSIADIIYPLAREKKLEFTVDLSGISRRNIYSDENMVKQVIINVLTNAVKFTDIGSINLKVTHPDMAFVRYQGIKALPEYTEKSYLLFSVSDTGIGIAEEDLNDIFDEYRQSDRAISKKYGGTGLGLAITRKILEELGGIIWVESEPSQGSVFNFIIPVERPKTVEEIDGFKDLEKEVQSSGA